MDYRHLVGVGPCVAAHALNTIPTSFFPALEDIQLKGKRGAAVGDASLEVSTF
jgi:hypothetical protein